MDADVFSTREKCESFEDLTGLDSCRGGVCVGCQQCDDGRAFDEFQVLSAFPVTEIEVRNDRLPDSGHEPRTSERARPDPVAQFFPIRRIGHLGLVCLGLEFADGTLLLGFIDQVQRHVVLFDHSTKPFYRFPRECLVFEQLVTRISLCEFVEQLRWPTGRRFASRFECDGQDEVGVLVGMMRDFVTDLEVFGRNTEIFERTADADE
ncbi:hypothetical protein VB773_21740 [Haloarculaceae archaeon H-GB2-1]|nr:hypothetical protein [Haloarculaceae archaeon H-GB1-1]MEA5409932.1 hypothetical protein [Haloarculaceae archaeon H-GB2-1]